MKKMIINYRLNILTTLAFLALLNACGGGGGGGDGDGGQTVDPDVDQVASNPDFIAKAEAVSFAQIRLFQGHINAVDATRLELDPSNLSSGELITIEVEFEIDGNLADYSLSAQLVPESVFSLMKQGQTLGEIIDKNSVPQQGIEFIDLGGVYVDEIDPGILHGFIHAKLPILDTDSVFKVLVAPSLHFLALDKDVFDPDAGVKPINDSDVEAIPVLLDDRELTIQKLEQVAVILKKTPDLTADNDFTELEIDAEFDANGLSVEPVFQTSIEVDLTTFNVSEDVVLSINYVDPGGNRFPLALLNADTDGNPLITEKAHFKVDRTGISSVILPVVAYTPIATYQALLQQSTPIRDIADQQVQIGNFQLEVFYLDNGAEVSAGPSYDLSIPLVSQPNRFQALSAEEAIGYTVLRAGPTNSACLRISAGAFDPDSGLLSEVVGAISEIVATACPSSPAEARAGPSLWRYDLSTKQIISQEKDINGDNHCITWIDKPVIPNSFLPNDFNLFKCEFKNGSDDIAIDSQRFIFEGQKIRVEIVPVYIDVIPSVNVAKEVTATQAADPVDVVDIFRNTNGVDVDSDGRLFYVGKFYDRSWGVDSLAKVELSYGGESYLDYMPALGSTSEGHATVSVGLLGVVSADLVDANFALKRYFPEKISFSGNNSPNVVVGNGASFTLDYFGMRLFDEGEITNTTLTETFDPLTDIGDVVLPDFLDLSETLVKRKLELELVEQTIIIVVVPVTITGGVKGTMDLDLNLSTPGLGINSQVTQGLTLSGFLAAKANLIVASAGLNGSVDVLNQKLSFAADAGFVMNNLEPKLTFEVGSSLLAELNLLKGKVTAFVDYPKPCWCAPPWKTKHAEEVIYESGYLFNEDWTVFDKNLNATVIK